MKNDLEIIKELTDELMAVSRVPPFSFAIAYDAKTEPARVTVHCIIKNGTMGAVEFTSIIAARAWVWSALAEGYTVTRVIGRRHDDSFTASLARRQSRYVRKAKYDAMTKAEREAEDEIPF